MQEKSSNRTWALLLVVVYLFVPVVVSADTPAEVIRSTADGVLGVPKDTALKPPDKRSERREKIRELIYPRFNFLEMAKRSLGPHWKQRSPKERQEFVKLFTDLLERSYADKIDSYEGEKVVYTKEDTDKDFAEVDTNIVTKKGEEFSVNYRLQNTGGDWKVDDIVIENISLVNNYRSEFNRVLSQSSFAELLRRMKAKQFQASAQKKKA